MPALIPELEHAQATALNQAHKLQQPPGQFPASDKAL